MNYIAANTQKSSWSNDLNMYTKKKKIKIYTLVHRFICRGFFPKKQTVFIFDSHSKPVVFSQTSSQSFHLLKTVELQFQGKQYIYLPKTLVEITDLATKISIPLALKISNIKSSHKRIQGTDGKLFSCQCQVFLLCHAFHQSVTALLEGEKGDVWDS